MLTNKQKRNSLVPENLGSATMVNLHVNDSTATVDDIKTSSSRSEVDDNNGTKQHKK